MDLMKLPARDAERLAYSEGFMGTAQLFARLAEAEETIHRLREQVDDLEDRNDQLAEKLGFASGDCDSMRHQLSEYQQ